MPNIQKYSDKLPSLGNLDLTALIMQNAPQEIEGIELIITIRKEKLNVKDFSSYLNFIYRVDGHLSEQGLLSYSHYPDSQIAISEIRIGSYDIVFEWLKSAFHDYNKVVILYFTLKYLPKVIQSYLDAIYKAYQIADIREDVLEKRRKRETREIKAQREKKEKRAYKKELRGLFNEEFPNLDKKQKEKLVETVAQLYLKVGYRNVSAARFAQQLMDDIKLFPKKKSSS